METNAQQLLFENIRNFRMPALLLREDAAEGIFTEVFVTDLFAELMECPLEEAEAYVSGEGYLAAVNPEDRIFVRRMLRHRVNENGGSDLTIRVTLPKGREIWCKVQFSFMNVGGETYAFCSYADTTSLREYEQRLKNAYTLLGTTFYKESDNTLALFRVNLTRDVVEDVQGRDLFSTDAPLRVYSRVFRKRAENIIVDEERKTFLERFDPDELSYSYLKGQSQVSQIVYSRRPSGECCYIRMTANMTREPMSNDIIAFLSEEKANQAKAKETLLESILAHQFDMVMWIANTKYGLVIVSDPNYPLNPTGDYPMFLQNHIAPFLHGTEEEKAIMLRSLLPEAIDEALRVKSPYVSNIAMEKNGVISYKRFDFYLVSPEAGFCVMLISDTTAIQMEQLRLNAQLSSTLEEAFQANTAKTTFLSRMSHEIRTPMNAIIGLDTLALREKDLSDTLQDYLTRIGESANHLLSLFNDILDMSRIDSGRMTIQREEFSLTEFLAHINEAAQEQCGRSGLEYTSEVRGTLDEFYIGDESKIRQVLSNIIDNAIKFTAPGGSVTFTVEHLSSFEGQCLMRFSVHDTGIGIDEAYIPHIFEPFSQEDSSNTSQYGGRGLGLSITKNLVGLMNGEIVVESEKGHGSTFIVTIPLREVTDESRVERAEIEAKDLCVLIVDNDPITREHTRVVLEDIGILSETCESREEAMKLLEADKSFNLILVDVASDKESIDTVRQIRTFTGEEPIIVLISYDSTDIERQARRAGVDGFMVKPIFGDEFLDDVKRIAQYKKTHTENREMADLNGRTVLLAEDMDINSEIIRELLAVLGITVDVAINGQVAIDMFSQSAPGHYDAILMDVRMPVLDGLAATRLIRILDRPDAKDVPIIAMTANAIDEDVQLSLRAGMNAHLTKPVEPERLEDTLSALIAKYDAARSKS